MSSVLRMTGYIRNETTAADIACSGINTSSVGWNSLTIATAPAATDILSYHYKADARL